MSSKFLLGVTLLALTPTVRGAEPSKARMTLDAHENGVSVIAFSPDGKTLYSGGSDDTVKFWDVGSGKNTAKLPHPAGVRCLAISPDGKRLASGTYVRPREDLGGEVRVWDIEKRDQLVVGRGFSSTVKMVDFSVDGKSVIAVEISGNVQICELETRKKTSSDLPMSVCYVMSPDRKMFATDEFAGLGINLRELVPGKPSKTLGRLEAHGVDRLTFSSDGNLLASGGREQLDGKTAMTVQIWDLKKKQKLATLLGHTDFVVAIAFSRDGKLLASGSQDKTIRVWDVATKACLATFTGHDSYIGTLAFSPDGKILASGSNDSTIKLWDAPTTK